MPEVTFTGRTVQIDENQIELPEEIFDVVAIESAVLVVCEPGEMDPRNLVAYDFDGNEIWRVPPLMKDSDDEPSSVNWVKPSDGEILAFTGSQRYKLDPDTGEAEYLGWYK